MTTIHATTITAMSPAVDDSNDDSNNNESYVAHGSSSYIDIELSSLGRLENLLITTSRLLCEEQQTSNVTFIVHLAERHNAKTMLISHCRLIVENDSSSRVCDENGNDVDANDVETSSHVALMRRVERAMLLAIGRIVRSDRTSPSRWLYERLHDYVETMFAWCESTDIAKREQSMLLDRLRLLVVLDEEEGDSKNEVTASVADTNDYDADERTVAVFLFFQWMSLMSVVPIECDRRKVNFAWHSDIGVVRVYVRDSRLTSTTIPTPLVAVESTTGNGHANEQRNSADVTTAYDDVMIRRSETHDCESHTHILRENVSAVCCVNTLTSYEPPANFMFTDGYEVVNDSSRPARGPVWVIMRGSFQEQTLERGRACVELGKCKPRSTMYCGTPGDDRAVATPEQQRVLSILQKVMPSNDFVAQENDANTIRPIEKPCQRHSISSETVVSFRTRRTAAMNSFTELLNSCDPSSHSANPTTRPLPFRESSRCEKETTTSTKPVVPFRKRRTAALNSFTEFMNSCNSDPSSRYENSVPRPTPFRQPTPTRRGSTIPVTTTPPLVYRRQRVIVDGVAGSGKTYLLGVMLRRFARVRYLVKTRAFVVATRKRFKNHVRLRAQTIDSFLMQQLDICNLQTWLNMRRSEMEELRKRARNMRLRAKPDELIFVDEYSLIENSLGELLNLVLRDSRVVLVGDCNQQPAIGERDDQAVRTLLGYENVCFMYDNVRARDARLLTRLTKFNARYNDDLCVDALHGLPIRRTVDLRDFLRDGTTRHDSLALLPRLIVVSNEKVNYCNWSIGYLLWRNCPTCRRGQEEKQRYTSRRSVTSPLQSPRQCSACLRYKRIVITDDEVTVEGTNRSSTDTTTQRREQLDDPYADEHFVVAGARYRMIHAWPSWPVQIGSRIIVVRIESPTCVLVETEDERRLRYRLRMTRVKPYEYGSVWNRDAATNRYQDENTFSSMQRYSRYDRIRDGNRNGAKFYMFPFVMDAATTVYQVQGLTLDQRTYARCYVDVQGMNEKALYVTLSRFENEDQIIGVLNCQTLT